MRIGVLLGVAVLASAAGGAVAASETAATPATKAVKVAAAESVAPAETPVAEPVTRASTPVVAKPKAQPPALIARIDLSAQRMTVSANGRVVSDWKISSGRSGHETPPGSFRPKWTSKMHYSRKYENSPMPYSVFFNGGIATHGTAYPGLLGQPASHGCIRLQTANARAFYDLVQRHGMQRTRIVVTGKARQTLTASRSRPGARSTTWGAAPRRQANNVWGATSHPLYSQYGSRRIVQQGRRWPGDRW